MPTYAFNRNDLDRWQFIAETERPKAPSNAQCVTAPMVDSFAMKGMHLGIAIALKLDNGQTVTLKINPAMGQFLRDEIHLAGA